MPDLLLNNLNQNTIAYEMEVSSASVLIPFPMWPFSPGHGTGGPD
jgi:hypothetical protein